MQQKMPQETFLIMFWRALPGIVLQMLSNTKVGNILSRFKLQTVYSLGYQLNSILFSQRKLQYNLLLSSFVQRQSVNYSCFDNCEDGLLWCLFSKGKKTLLIYSVKNSVTLWRTSTEHCLQPRKKRFAWLIYLHWNFLQSLSD